MESGVIGRLSEPPKYNFNFIITNKINSWYDRENQIEPKKNFI
jgi:hypothetical protein